MKKISINGIAKMTGPGATLTVTVEYLDGTVAEHEVIAALKLANELTYYQHGGILHYVLRKDSKPLSLWFRYCFNS